MVQTPQLLAASYGINVALKVNECNPCNRTVKEQMMCFCEGDKDSQNLLTTEGKRTLFSWPESLLSLERKQKKLHHLHLPIFYLAHSVLLQQKRYFLRVLQCIM